MSEVAAAHLEVEPQETPLTPESWGKLGMWLFLAGDAMSFGCLIVGYGILRHASNNWPVPKDVLGINLTAFMTFLLIVSSVWMVLALAAIQENDKARFNKFLGLTILGRCDVLGVPGLRVDSFARSSVARTRHLIFQQSLRHDVFYSDGFSRHARDRWGNLQYLRAGGGQPRPLSSETR